MKKITQLLFISLLTLILISCGSKKVIYATFITNGGNEIESQKIELITDIDQSHTPYKEGFSFQGWYLDKATTIHFKEETFSANQKVMFYAKWKPKEDGMIDEVSLYMQAYLNMQNAKSFEVETTGKIDPNMSIIPKQDLKSVKIKDGKTFYNFTVSKGMVSTFYEIYGTHETSTLKRGTKVKKDLTPETVNETQELSLETFKETYGLMPYELNYLVNSQTVIGIKNSIKENNTHIFTLVLDNELSTQNYKTNIVATNTAKSKPPVFDKIELTVYINQDGYFEKIIYHETYHIEIELPILGFRTQKITTQITEEFKSFNQAVSINPFDI